jgi:hypothetical protein
MSIGMLALAAIAGCEVLLGIDDKTIVPAEPVPDQPDGGGMLDGCPIGFEECAEDGTRCETEVATSREHCGGCRRPCGGVCTAGDCLAPPEEGLVLWLRGDEGLEASGDALRWRDQQSGEDAVANEPGSVPAKVEGGVWPAGPAVHFDGDDRLAIPTPESTLSDGFTFAIAMRPDTARVFDGLFYLGAPGNVDSIAVMRELTTDRARVSIQNGIVFNPAVWWEGIVQSFGGFTTPGPPEILVAIQDPGDATISFYRDGKIVPKDWGDAPLPHAVVRTIGYLGWVPSGEPDPGWQYFEGTIAEVLLYERAIDAGERRTLEEYLAGKLDIPLATPAPTGPVEILAEEQSIPAAVAVHGAAIAWPNEEGGQIMLRDEDGVRVVFADTARRPDAVALDESHAYWVDRSGRIARVPREGGVEEAFDLHGELKGIAVSDDIAAAAGFMPDGQLGALVWCSKSEWTSPTAIALPYGSGPVAIDATHIYFALHGDGADARSVRRVPKGAVDLSEQEILATNLVWANTVAVDDEFVYFTDDGAIKRVSKSEPLAVTNLTPSLPYPRGLTVDERFVYYTSCIEEGTIGRVPKDGGPFESIATGQPWPRGIEVMGAYLVWTNSDGTVARAPKRPWGGPVSEGRGE